MQGGLLKPRSARDATRAAWSHAALVGAVLCWGACGSHDEPPALIDNLARAIADALCNNIGPCCRQAGLPHDPAECHALAEASYLAKIERNRHNPNVVYDENAARACIDAYATAAKSCPAEQEILSVCRHVFTGTLRVGQACTGYDECIPVADCLPADRGGNECQWSPFKSRGKLGDRCSWTCIQVGVGTTYIGAGRLGDGTLPCFTTDGLYCDDATAVCASAPGIGQPCGGKTQCAGADTFCDNLVCANKRATGSCGSDLRGCVATSYCELSAQQCTARKSTGAACTTNNECPATDGCTEGTCRPRTIASPSLCRGDI